jgi:hypothetical protein
VLRPTMPHTRQVGMSKSRFSRLKCVLGNTVFLEIMTNSVEMESGSNLFSGDGCWSFFLLLPHSPFQPNSSNSALASCKSLVSNPSVNQR